MRRMQTQESTARIQALCEHGHHTCPIASELVQHVPAACWACPGRSHIRLRVHGWDGAATGHGIAKIRGCMCRFLGLRMTRQ